MIIRKQKRTEGRDGTAAYFVTLDKTYTVEEFIKAILMQYPKEWGYIGIKNDEDIFGNPNCEYKKGVLLSKLPKNFLCKTITSVSADGGYTRMDYLIDIKSEE